MLQICQRGNLHSEQCPSEWIGYRKKCYFISEEEKNWTSSQAFCIKNESLLAVFENKDEMVMEHKTNQYNFCISLFS